MTSQTGAKSDFDRLRIVKTDTVTLSKTANSTGVQVSVDHDLGFVPIVFAYVDSAGGLFGLTGGGGIYDAGTPGNSLPTERRRTRIAADNFSSDFVSAWVQAFVSDFDVTFIFATPASHATENPNLPYYHLTATVKYYLLQQESIG